jgi:lipopolysaccharide export LptBFGC system permease protein LptF
LVPLSHPRSATLLLYLLPQALPLSVPVGLTFGILWGFGRAAASRRSRTVVLIVAVTFSAVSFTMLAWVVPATNQAFRVSLMGRPVMKGVNELTLGELSQLIETRGRDPKALPNSRDVRRLALNYHARWALAGAPFVLSLFSVSVTHRRRRDRWILGLAGCAAISGYYIIMYAAKEFGLSRTVPALAAAWAPNVAFLLVSVPYLAGSLSTPVRPPKNS